MGVDYYRVQRPSIYHPATIGDIPFEVIQKALRLLGRADLISASLSCRAWSQAAAELIVAQKFFNNEKAMERFVCGMQFLDLSNIQLKSLILCCVESE
jgi:DNA-binding transcriptional regulator YhcF (GntR family)